MKERWEYSILQSIDALGGEADLQEIYKKITDFLKLTEEHLKESYERPAYQHQIRSHTIAKRDTSHIILTSVEV